MENLELQFMKEAIKQSKIAFKNNEDFACDWILFSFHVLNEQLIFSHFKSPVQEQ